MKVPVKTPRWVSFCPRRPGPGGEERAAPLHCKAQRVAHCLHFACHPKQVWWGLLGVEPVQYHELELHSGTEASYKKLNGVRCLYFSVYKYFCIFFNFLNFFCNGICFAMTVVCCRDTTRIELLLELLSSFPLKLASPQLSLTFRGAWHLRSGFLTLYCFHQSFLFSWASIPSPPGSWTGKRWALSLLRMNCVPLLHIVQNTVLQ